MPEVVSGARGTTPIIDKASFCGSSASPCRHIRGPVRHRLALDTEAARERGLREEAVQAGPKRKK